MVHPYIIQLNDFYTSYTYFFALRRKCMHTLTPRHASHDLEKVKSRSFYLNKKKWMKVTVLPISISISDGPF